MWEHDHIEKRSERSNSIKSVDSLRKTIKQDSGLKFMSKPPALKISTPFKFQLKTKSIHTSSKNTATKSNRPSPKKINKHHIAKTLVDLDKSISLINKKGEYKLNRLLKSPKA